MTGYVFLSLMARDERPLVGQGSSDFDEDGSTTRPFTPVVFWERSKS